MTETTRGPKESPEDDGTDAPSLRQRLHAATGDRDAEAKALADRSPDEVTQHDAAVAVNRAHGDSVDHVPTESELASPDDAKRVADDEKYDSD